MRRVCWVNSISPGGEIQLPAPTPSYLPGAFQEAFAAGSQAFFHAAPLGDVGAQ